MNFDFDSMDRVEKDFSGLFECLSMTQRKIRELLVAHSDGKVLKGDELVGWLGEIYTKIAVNGYLVDDSFEHDVETTSGLTISVKTRRGTNNGWRRTSAIPKVNGDGIPSHLMFVHLSENYVVSEMWLYPWRDLLEQNRFRKHLVRGNFRSYYMSVNPSKDQSYLVYTNNS
ncbi:MAG: hypothetical protein CMF12_03580 [Idiomarina sp.]|uniref:hypothetical protein n=1 Tax=Idiomarina sp. TaxID=1874361 RepID=UPI000C661959|nr:hypothetical protein [Idiomarina sp.]MBT41586.1 hypothetical protein [Idiomarina sp.]